MWFKYNRILPFTDRSRIRQSLTRNLWYKLAQSHDFETLNFITTAESQDLNFSIFQANFYQLTIISLWITSFCFHIRTQRNFNVWLKDPLHIKPIAHFIRDPQFRKRLIISRETPTVVMTSRLNQWFYTIRFHSELAILQAGVILLGRTGLLFLITWLHRYFDIRLRWFQNINNFILHHLTTFFRLCSLLWTRHLVHIALPNSRRHIVTWRNFLLTRVHPQRLKPLFQYRWLEYSQNRDGIQHIFRVADPRVRTAILTWTRTLNKLSRNLPLSDIAHHHLALRVILLVLRHRVQQWRFGRENIIILFKSLHFQLAISLSILRIGSSLFAHHIYSFPSFAYLAYDHTSLACLFVHHQYIARSFICRAFAHRTIYLIRDYNMNFPNPLIAFILTKRYTIINYLSYVSLFLRFHTLRLYVHNDFMQAIGLAEKQICLFPIFAQWIQYTQRRDIRLPIRARDLLVHHRIALRLHVTTLILLKRALTSRSSKLIPDKLLFRYAFPCDRPRRRRTCDISSWDSLYLALFWILNTIRWTTFYWHWKNLTLWIRNRNLFTDSSLYLIGWFRDYLWLNSTQLINRYTPFRTNRLSVWAWIFLFGHLIWAIGFIFLISWRRYWQELIETIVWAHAHTPLAIFIQWRNKPVALSIVQARLVRIAHFRAGYILTYAPFVIASTLSLN